MLLLRFCSSRPAVPPWVSSSTATFPTKPDRDGKPVSEFRPATCRRPDPAGSGYQGAHRVTSPLLGLAIDWNGRFHWGDGFYTIPPITGRKSGSRSTTITGPGPLWSFNSMRRRQDGSSDRRDLDRQFQGGRRFQSWKTQGVHRQRKRKFRVFVDVSTSGSRH